MIGPPQMAFPLVRTPNIDARPAESREDGEGASSAETAKIPAVAPKKATHRDLMDRLVYVAADMSDEHLDTFVRIAEELGREPGDSRNDSRWSVLRTFLRGLESTRRA